MLGTRMELSGFNKRSITTFLIFSLISIGFVGLLVIKDFINESTVSGAVISVNDDGGADYFSIQAAIDNASNGDTIYVWPGTYYGNIIIDKSITLIGNSPGNTTIDGNAKSHVIFITSDWVNISGLTVKNSSQSMPVFYEDY